VWRGVAGGVEAWREVSGVAGHGGAWRGVAGCGGAWRGEGVVEGVVSRRETQIKGGRLGSKKVMAGFILYQGKLYTGVSKVETRAIETFRVRH
jgi:hypothetical protein